MFIAGWNMPGYLPENDPVEFESFDDAHAYIVEELNSWIDQDSEIPSRNDMQLMHALHELDPTNELSWWTPGELFTVEAAGYAFWVYSYEEWSATT